MKNFIKFFIKYPTWSNTVLIIVLLFGALALFNMKSSFFPERESKNINISVIFPGASPEEVETGIVQKIEDNLKGVQGIEIYQSTSKENSAEITVEVLEEFDTDEVLIDIRNAVDRINSFPAGIEPPVVSKRPATEFAFSFSIYGDLTLNELKEIGRKVEDDLRANPIISEVKISGFPDREINIALDDEQLRRYKLSFDEIVMAIREKNRDITAGMIRTDSEELLIRYQGKEYYADYFLDIVVKTDSYGAILKLSDIAKIEDRWAESPQRTFVNGKPSIIVSIDKLYGENILDITDAAKEYLDKFPENYTNVKAELINDATKSLRKRISILLNNGILGAMLVIASLALFLNWRLAFWVAMSLPFSFLGMFLVAYFFDITINVISLFGCIIVVGIVVDDGIVVAEQIYQKYEEGFDPYRAAIRGTLQVLPSVFFAIITTVIAFLPFFFLDTPGPRISDMSFVVIFVLLFSLIEVVIILPTHLAHSKALSQKVEKSKIRKKFDLLIEYPRDSIYKPVLDFFIKYKALPIALSTFFIIITLGGFGGGWVKTTFFPSIDRDNFSINIELPSGSRDFETRAVLDKIEQAVWDVNEDLKKKTGDNDNIEKVVKNIASLPSGWGRASAGNANVGNLQVYLMDEEVRKVNSNIIANLISEKVGVLKEVDKAEFGTSSFFGKPISIPLIGKNIDELQKAKNELKSKLSEISDLRDVTDNDPQGFREIYITLKDKAYLLGLTPGEISRQIRQGFFGEEVQRIQRGSDEVKIWVRYTQDYRSNIKNLEDMRIRIQGNEYILNELIDYEIKRGPIIINHIDGAREITIEADTKDPNAEVPILLNQIQEQILNPLFDKYPSVSTVDSGQKKRINKLLRGLIILPVAFVLMFFIVGLSFRSMLQSLLVFLLIPFGIMGAVWGHIIQGMSFNIISFYGLIALVGIIVNDSIVFINTFNQNIKDGMSFKEAITNAAVSRFRPILLTTVTTVLGLLPLLAEASITAQFLIPMAISVAYGLIFASVFILVLLPVLLHLANRLRTTTHWLIKGETLRFEKIEPAYIEDKLIKEHLGENE